MVGDTTRRETVTGGVTILHMTGAYLSQEFYRERNARELDFRNISGTHGYCDEEAKVVLQERLANISHEGIHFLDSGNYHYLSLFFLRKITEPFSLVVFDHHPDLQRPAFGAVTSCGGWVREALETLPNLQQVCLIGPEEDSIRMLLDEAGEDGTDAWIREADKVCWDGNALVRELPLYLSFDKDVLREQDCLCDWDQGTMSLAEAKGLLSELLREHRLLGVDICGEESRWETREGPEGEKIRRINDRTNRELLEFLEQRITNPTKNQE